MTELTLANSIRTVPKPSPPSADALARITALERELARTRRTLYLERAVREFPAIEPVIDLITAEDEHGIRSQAARLAAHTGA